jgi:NADPH:quinone reductase-like Zn-dependent oxidoreductase
MVDSIVRIAQLQFTQTEEVPEREFCVSNSKTYISRLVRNTALNELLTPSTKAEPASFSPGSRISGKIQGGKVVFEQHGAAAAPKVKAGHVDVQVQYSGLTHEGVLVITGSDYPTTFSHEIGGVVTKVGAGVTTLKRGDRVVGFNVDKFSSQQQVPATMLHQLTPREDMSTAVSLLMAYAGALYGLDSLAKVQPHETVLILHNTGASGAAAVKIVQARGAIPYVEAKTVGEFDFLHDTLGLAAENIIRPADGSVSARIQELTNAQGVDVVFSSGGAVDANAAREAWRSIASFGRFVDGGRKDVLNRKALDAVPVQRGALYMPFDLIYILDARPQLIANLLPSITDMFRKGSIAAPGPVERVHLSALDKAVSTFSNAFGATKSIIEYTESVAPIQVIPLPKRAKPAFRPDATYLLVGCLGGLGRSLTSWMMECGARRFAFLSRSGADSKAAAKLVKDIETRGANVLVIRGDATSQADVVRAVSQVPSAFPIRGVVHAAMVLRVSHHTTTFWMKSFSLLLSY